MIKAVGAELAHKSELGAVALDLRDQAAVEAAALRMAGLGEAILVEPMIADGVAELILGVVRDPQVGLCLVLGSGGVMVELLGGSCTATAADDRRGDPVRRSGAEGGAPAAGLPGPAGGRRRRCGRPLPWRSRRFAAAHADRLVELDVNPLIVRPAGMGVGGGRRSHPTDRRRSGFMSEAVRTSAADGILEVVLDRPKANAIDSATSRALGRAFAAFRDDPSLRVAIVTGGGEKFFSAGWDLKAVAEGSERPDSDYGVGGFGGLQELPDLNKPVIAALNGMTVGGGFELALSCDLILAAEHVRFGLPEIKAGTLADAATIKLPRRIPHHVAMDLLLTGRWMDAAEAKHWGLVNEILPADRLLPRAREIARLLADGPPLVFAAIKETLRRTEGLPFQSAMDLVTAKRCRRSSGSTRATTSSRVRGHSPRSASPCGRGADVSSGARQRHTRFVELAAPLGDLIGALEVERDRGIHTTKDSGQLLRVVHPQHRNSRELHQFHASEAINSIWRRANLWLVKPCSSLSARAWATNCSAVRTSPSWALPPSRAWIGTPNA